MPLDEIAVKEIEDFIRANSPFKNAVAAVEKSIEDETYIMPAPSERQAFQNTIIDSEAYVQAREEIMPSSRSPTAVEPFQQASQDTLDQKYLESEDTQ